MSVFERATERAMSSTSMHRGGPDQALSKPFQTNFRSSDAVLGCGSWRIILPGFGAVKMRFLNCDVKAPAGIAALSALIHSNMQSTMQSSLINKPYLAGRSTRSTASVVPVNRARSALVVRAEKPQVCASSLLAGIGASAHAGLEQP